MWHGIVERQGRMRVLPARVDSVLLASLLLIASAATAQGPEAASVPVAGAPPWRISIHMPDGRTFVSNGHIAIDAALADVDPLPASVGEASILATYFTAAYDTESPFEELTVQAGSGPTAERGNYRTPSGVVLNGMYIEYLRQVLPRTQARLRTRGPADPVLLVLDGKAVGLLMPVKQ